MAIQFGSGSTLAWGSIIVAADTQGPGNYAEELPVADATPSSQTNGHRVMVVGRVKTADPVNATIFFNSLDPNAPYVSTASQTLTLTMGPSGATVAGTAYCTRFELANELHDGLIMANVTFTWAGGSGTAINWQEET